MEVPFSQVSFAAISETNFHAYAFVFMLVFLFEYAYPIMISTPENSFCACKIFSTEIYECF